MTAVTTRALGDRLRRRTTSPSPAASSTWAATRWARASTPTRGSSPSGSSTPAPWSWARPPRTCTTASRSSPRSAPTRTPWAARTSSPRPTPTARSSPTWSPSRPGTPSRLGPRHGRRAAAPGHDAREPGRAQDAVPPARPRHRGQRRRPQRRRHRLPARRRGGRRRARAAGRGCGWSAYAFAGVEPEVMGVGPVPATEKALRQGRPDHRRHRPVRAQRGVRRPGARLPRPLRHRRRRPARQPVRRRDRRRPPARLLRRAADDPAGPAVRRAPRGPLRPDRDVHRHRHGRHRHLGEPPPRRLREQRRRRDDATTSDHTSETPPRAFPTRSSPTPACATSPSPAAARWPSSPSTTATTTPSPTRFGPAAIAELERDRSTRLRERAEAGEIVAVAITGKPFIFAVGADLTGVPQRHGPRDEALADRASRARGIRRLADLPVPTFAFVNGAAMGGGVEIALHCRLPDDLAPGPRPSRCPRSSSAWCPAGAAATCCPASSARRTRSPSSSRTR